jgi:Recombination endonuclease VII
MGERPSLVGREIWPVLIEIQQGRCGACPSEGPLVVDHDHETGIVRGLLCRGCNSREGKLESGLFYVTPDAGMLAYLANPPAAPFGWLWDYPDPRMNPERMAADLEHAMAYLTTVKLPPLDGSPVVVEAAAEDEPRRRDPLAPVSIEQAIADLRLAELPPLTF